MMRLFLLLLQLGKIVSRFCLAYLARGFEKRTGLREELSLAPKLRLRFNCGGALNKALQGRAEGETKQRKGE
jgi:hypothetical protein